MYVSALSIIANLILVSHLKAIYSSHVRRIASRNANNESAQEDTKIYMYL